MKRVIEINKEVYEEITCDEGCGLNELTRMIAKSKPLNKVLDKIVAEIEKLSCFSFTMGNGKVVETPLVNKDVVANIINKYKESEGK